MYHDWTASTSFLSSLEISDVASASLPCRVGHYLSLVVAENPLEQHREYVQQQQVCGFLPVEVHDSDI